MSIEGNDQPEGTQKLGAVRVQPSVEPEHDARERTEAEIRADELSAEVAAADARRAEEQAAKAAQAASAAQAERVAAEQRAESERAEAQRIREEAERARSDAQATGALGSATGPAASGAAFARPVSQAIGDPIVFGPFTAQNPERLVLAALVGGFLVGRLLRKVTS